MFILKCLKSKAVGISLFQNYASGESGVVFDAALQRWQAMQFSYSDYFK
jgi:hypothetical protein